MIYIFSCYRLVGEGAIFFFQLHFRRIEREGPGDPKIPHPSLLCAGALWVITLLPNLPNILGPSGPRAQRRRRARKGPGHLCNVLLCISGRSLPPLPPIAPFPARSSCPHGVRGSGTGEAFYSGDSMAASHRSPSRRESSASHGIPHPKFGVL